MPGWLKGGVLPVLLVVVLGGAGVLHLFFAKAEVTLWPQTRAITLLEPFVAQSGAREGSGLSFTTLSVTKEGTRLFEASSKTVKEDRAAGTIRVFNAYTASPQTLIAQTRFVSEGGKMFRTPSRLTVPGMTDRGPGFIDVKVVAAEAGEDYNIGPSNFSLPGLSGSPLYTAIYAESTEPMTGGSEREVSVVSKEDIEAAKDALIAELTEKAAQDLLSRVPEGMAASEDSIVEEVLEADSLVEAGAELKQFNVTASVAAIAYLFSKEDLDALAEDFLAGELGVTERIVPQKTKVYFEGVTVQGEGKVSLELGIAAEAYEYVDPTELKIRLRGKAKNEAASILSSYEAFLQADISLWPFWIGSVPGNVDKLEIHSVLD